MCAKYVQYLDDAIALVSCHQTIFNCLFEGGPRGVEDLRSQYDAL